MYPRINNYYEYHYDRTSTIYLLIIHLNNYGGSFKFEIIAFKSYFFLLLFVIYLTISFSTQFLVNLVFLAVLFTR